MSAVAKQNTELAPAKAQSPLQVVSKTVRDFLQKGTLHLPPDYSAENAMKAAWLMLQTVEDKDRKPALSVCTQESVVNALMSMVIQGLNVDKKQGYFIVYGKALSFQRSYFGDEALVKREIAGATLYYDVIYEGDVFATEKTMTSRGLITTVKQHDSPFPRKSDKIIGAYCGVVDGNGENLGVELMSMEQIKKSWEKSKTIGDKSFHATQPDQACIRTVVRRRCKPIINSSSDKILLQAIREQEMDSVDAEIAEEALDHANGEILTLPIAEPEPSEPEAPEGEEVKRSAQGNVMDDQPPLGQDTPY